MGEHLKALNGTKVHIPTEQGLVAGLIFQREGLFWIALSRHGVGHKTPPHLVNYRAMSLAVKKLEAKVCLSSAAVGSLDRNLPPGSIVVCDGMLDFSGRNITHFDTTVSHTPMNHPFSASCVETLTQVAKSRGVSPKLGTYVGMNGPRYETPQEIQMLSQLGGHVVGMTVSSESVVFGELGISYGCLAVVTNFGAGLVEQQPNHEEVVEMMNEKGKVAFDVLLESLVKLRS